MELSDDSKMLGYYSVTSGMEIYVIDLDPFSLSRGGGLTDTSLIEKYKMTDEEYDTRKGTLRDFIRTKKQEDPNYKLAKPSQSHKPTNNFVAMTDTTDEYDEASVQGIATSMRCLVNPGSRRGTVKFVGQVENWKPGYWVRLPIDPC